MGQRLRCLMQLVAAFLVWAGTAVLVESLPLLLLLLLRVIADNQITHFLL